MNVAMLTVMAISHGLCFGTQGRSFKRNLPFSMYDTVPYRIAELVKQDCDHEFEQELRPPDCSRHICYAVSPPLRSP
jgi:hypothetical protein